MWKFKYKFIIQVPSREVTWPFPRGYWKMRLLMFLFHRCQNTEDVWHLSMMKQPPGLQRHRRVVARRPAMPRFPRHENSGATVDGSMNSCVHQLRESLRIQSPCQMMIGGYNHLLNKVFRFHYHSQKVIGSQGNGRFYPIIYKVF